MQSSTVVMRTEAGVAELAIPAHGLSLTQRRYLTLLDTSCTVEELALRQRAAAPKVERDLARLAQLGLVVCDIPVPANDVEAASPATVRLGPARGRRLALILLPVVAAALAFAGWQQWTAADVATGDHKGGVVPSRKATQQVPNTPLADPQPIATRVLKTDAVDRSRDGAREKEPRVAGKGETHVEPPAARPPLPVEHRSPARDDPRVATSAPAAAARALIAAPTIGAPIPAPVRATSMTTDPLLPLPPAPPAPAMAANAAAAPALAATATVTQRTPTAPRDDDTTPPMQVASAAPAAGRLQPAPASASAVIPISRESPTFPREAIALGLSRGEVKARVTIDAKGDVSDVAIVDASHRAFNRAVREALARWRFPPGAADRTTTIDVAFKRD